MNSLGNRIVALFGYLFALLVLGFTGIQTWSLLFEASGDPVVATIGLVLFEAGMVYWWYTFQTAAEGVWQMAISLVMAIFGLVLVAGASALHLGAVDGNILGPHTPARLIVLAAIVNLIGKFLFPLVAPTTFEDIWTRALEGKITLSAYKDAEAKVDDLAAEISNNIGREISRRVQTRMLSHYGLAPVGLPGSPIEQQGNGVQGEAMQPQPPLPADAPENAQWVWGKPGEGQPFQWLLAFPPRAATDVFSNGAHANFNDGNFT